MEHEWVTVKNRRWCLGCSAFNQKVNDAAPWPYSPGPTCARNTIYARNADGTLEKHMEPQSGNLDTLD